MGDLTSAKGIAEGVSNSNWLIETTGEDGSGARFILTMYERRIETDDLPFFLGLLDHLSARGCPVPRTIHDRKGAAFRKVEGKAVALIEFLPGISPASPTPAQAQAVGGALATMHEAARDYRAERTNDLQPADWRALFDKVGWDALAGIDPSLTGLVRMKLPELRAAWPKDLPRSVIHADLFPDNVLMLDDRVSALIDFYFACNDLTAYDFAITHAAWCFDREGRNFDGAVSDALLRGYEEVRPFSDEERQALPVLTQGACMRFIATRTFDWIDTPEGALVTRKDPLDFARRLQFYARASGSLFASQA